MEPFINVLKLCQKDGSEWNKIYREFVNAIAEVQSKGLENVALVAQSRKSWILNDIIALNAINVTGFEEYAADREFHGYDTPVPRKLEMFIKFKLNKISTSEAAVERCFSFHKLIHSPMRASLSDEIVDKLLFIRYNHIIKYPGFVTFDKSEDDAALNELEEFEVF